MAKKVKDNTTGEESEMPPIRCTVVALQESRMRAGLQFSRTPREVEVTEEQRDAIAADPLLAIVSQAAESAPQAQA